MVNLDNTIINFGNRFYDRLNPELLKYAIEYIDFNERGLAFETICDHLSEYNVPITLEEYGIAITIADILGISDQDHSLLHLKELIK